MIRVADYIVDRICQEGVQHIFLVTGRGNLFLSDAVARRQDLQSVCVHHEQAAAYAAVAYAQSNERMGVCLVSTGCAATNAITAVLGAWQDGVPCLIVSGQNMLRETSRYTGLPLRTYGQQENDIVRQVEPITKYATMLTDPQRIAYEFDKAMHLAQESRKGPVWIDIPLDLQNARIVPEELERFEAGAKADLAAQAQDIEDVLRALEKAERPAVLLGNGVRSARAIPELEEFIRRAQIPVTFTASGADVYGVRNELSIGVVGSIGGTRAANLVVQNSDLLLVLGSRLSSMTTGPDFESFARAAKIIVVDIDSVEHSKKTVRIDRLVRCDAKKFLVALLQSDLPTTPGAWKEKCTHWKKIFPLCEEKFKDGEKVDLYYLAQSLSEVLDEKAQLVCDAGLEELILPSVVCFGREQRCIHPASQGSMGYALPAAMGVCLASGEQTVAVIGDGSIMMNLQELQTIRHYNLPIKIVAVNNNVYAVIRKRQVELFRSRTIGTDPQNGVSCPSFEKVAECFEIPYVRIETSANLAERLAAVLRMEGPVLCEVMATEDQEYLRTAHALNSKRRIVQRPLEDLAPFLDRELFLSEMVIEPLEASRD